MPNFSSPVVFIAIVCVEVGMTHLAAKNISPSFEKQGYFTFSAFLGARLLRTAAPRVRIPRGVSGRGAVVQQTPGLGDGLFPPVRSFTNPRDAGAGAASAVCCFFFKTGFKCCHKLKALLVSQRNLGLYFS